MNPQATKDRLLAAASEMFHLYRGTGRTMDVGSADKYQAIFLEAHRVIEEMQKDRQS